MDILRQIGSLPLWDIRLQGTQKGQSYFAPEYVMTLQDIQKNKWGNLLPKNANLGE